MRNIFDTNPGQLNLFTEPQTSPQTSISKSNDTIIENTIPIPKIQPSTLIAEEPISQPEHVQVVSAPAELDPVIEEKLVSELNKSSTVKKTPGFFVKTIQWFKRQMMRFRRFHKRYKIWKHKLGKIELDPTIRQEFRTQRRHVSDLFKNVDRLLDQVEIQGSKVEKIEEFAVIADDVLNVLQEQTESVSNEVASLQEKTKMMR